MLIIANTGGYVVKKCQKRVYVICEGSLSCNAQLKVLKVLKMLKVQTDLTSFGP